MYLPYWTFDSQTSSDYTAEFGRDRRVKRGDKEEIVTDWFRTHGHHDQFFDDELVCGTDQHDSGLLQGIEPYDTADNKGKCRKHKQDIGCYADMFRMVCDEWES
jgi:hypothetical protein